MEQSDHDYSLEVGEPGLVFVEDVTLEDFCKAMHLSTSAEERVDELHKER